MFVEYGFHGTATAKVAQEAGVANGTLFHHYKTKDELVLAIYVWIKDELEASLAAITHDSDFITPKFKTIFTATLHWALQNRGKFYYLRQFELSPHYANVPTGDNQTILDRLIAEGIRRKILRTHPAELILTLYNNHVFGLYQYITQADLEPNKQTAIISEGYEMIWGMLKYA
ncbi:TetR/AcrR family transcriptional regulator [Mucilaginibacter myungsuensis]